MNYHDANCLCQFCRYSQSVQQQALGMLPSNVNDYARQIMSDARRSVIPNVARKVLASDLGIVDQLLDDKVGMEP